MSEKAIFNQELVGIFASHYKLFILVPLLAALIVYAIGSLGPDRYVSSTYIKIDKATAKAADVLMAGENFRLNDTDPQIADPHLYRLDVEHRSPQEAQKAAAALLETWLNATKPRPAEQAMLQLRLESKRAAATEISALVERLKGEAKTLVQSQGELATPIANLISQRDRYRIEAAEIEARLAGVPPDVVVKPPSLPGSPIAKSAKGRAVLAAFASIPLLMAILLLVRFYREARVPTFGRKGA
jgi:hypothetical protein